MNHETPRKTIFGIEIGDLRINDAARLICEKISSCSEFSYVVTPNVDHIVNLQKDTEFKDAYRSAFYISADGWPIVAASRFLEYKIPERVAGSDLVPAILSLANREKIPLSVFILGGVGDVPKKASEFIIENYPNLRIAGYYSPPFGFEKNTSENRKICSLICESGANLVIVGLGSPKQEKWVYNNRKSLPPSIAICAGATVDFMAGTVKRAPAIYSRIGMEWFYRLSKEPRRLFSRYMKGLILFPLIFLSELSKKTMHGIKNSVRKVRP